MAAREDGVPPIALCLLLLVDPVVVGSGCLTLLMAFLVLLGKSRGLGMRIDLVLAYVVDAGI